MEEVTNQDWYVVFCESDFVKAPFRWFTCPGFRHCFCFAEGPGGTLIMNYTHHHCEVRISIGDDAASVAFDFVNAGAKVLKVTTNKNPKFLLRGSVYCVTLTKALLGIRGCWAVSPKGLHDWLKRSNLKIIDLNLIASRV